jgi:hypothetical protein
MLRRREEEWGEIDYVDDGGYEQDPICLLPKPTGVKRIACVDVQKWKSEIRRNNTRAVKFRIIKNFFCDG